MLAGVLGAARDAQVMHARLSKLIAAEPDDLVLGKVQGRVDSFMTRRWRTAHDAVLAELDGERYLQLLDSLDACRHRASHGADVCIRCESSSGVWASGACPRATWPCPDARLQGEVGT